MKICVLILLIVVVVSGCNTERYTGYEFRGKLTESVLRNYLSKAVTHAELCTHPDFMQDGVNACFEDDIRMINNLGAKFIGRSFFRWGGERAFNGPKLMAYASQIIDQIHSNDPEVVFQAAIFEAVSSEVETLPIPKYVFQGFNLPIEERNFEYSAMLSPDGRYVDHWGTGISVPDISRMETKLWLYYLATKYVNSGFEAIHWGQVALMAMNDADLYHWKKLLDIIRVYARNNARRNYVLFDSHAPTGGFKVGDSLLFDFHSFPLRILEDTTQIMGGKLEYNYLDAIYGRSLGGITPSGWTVESLPYLVEFDNFGISSEPGNPVSDSHFIWGYDEISWFSLKSDDDQKEWLEYAFNWVRGIDPNGYLQMPTCRVVVDGVRERHKFKANIQSEGCLAGTSLEEKIKALWIE